MQTKRVNVARVLGIFVLSVLCNVSEGGPVSDGTARQQPLQAVQHQELLQVLREVERVKNKWDVHKKFQTYPKTERLETLAYCLMEGTNTSAALQEIINDKEMQDNRLVGCVAKSMQRARGEELFLAVLVANRLSPDRVMLAPLVEHALDDEYMDVATVGGNGEGTEFIYNSVFAEAAEAIYRITDGRMGSEKVRRDKTLSEQEKKALIQKWRQTWNAERKSKE